MAEETQTTETEDTGATETQTVDYSWMPEQFRPEGKPDTAAFIARYDELAAFKSQADEKTAAAPKSVDEYKLDLPTELALPEGLSIPEGYEVKIDNDDPDLPAFKQLALKHGLTQEAVTDLMQLEAVRQIRGAADANKEHGEQIAALGPDGKSRIETISRQIKSTLPEGQANALIDGIHSADALRAVEALMSRNAKAPGGPGAGADYSNLTAKDLIRVGLANRRAS